MVYMLDILPARRLAAGTVMYKQTRRPDYPACGMTISPTNSVQSDYSVTVILCGFAFSDFGRRSVNRPCSMDASIFDVSIAGSSSKAR